LFFSISSAKVGSFPFQKLANNLGFWNTRKLTRGDIWNLSRPSAIFSLGQELSVKPFSLLSTNPRNLDPRTVVLKEDLLAMKDTARSSGSLFI